MALKARWALEPSTTSGKGVYCEGILLNEKGDTITRFHPFKFGIGSFSFTPLAGSKYKALVKLPGGEQTVKELPAAYNNGYAMHLENTTEGQIKITVQTRKEQFFTCCHFSFCTYQECNKSSNEQYYSKRPGRFLLDDTKPGEGISHFTVFNEYRQPVCERLFFKKPVRNLTNNCSYRSAIVRPA